MELRSTIVQHINKKKTVQKHKNQKKKNLFLYIFIGILTGIFILFPPDYMFIYTVLTGKANTDTYGIDQEKQEERKLFPLSIFKNYTTYYRAVQLAEHDSEQAKNVLTRLLDNNIRKGLRKKVLALLGELYLLEKEYSMAATYFWDLLILYPNNIHRINYEIVSNYADIFKQVQDKEVSNLQSETGIEQDVPVNLETIKQTNTFFLTVSDEIRNPSLPQW